MSSFASSSRDNGAVEDLLSYVYGTTAVSSWLVNVLLNPFGDKEHNILDRDKWRYSKPPPPRNETLAVVYLVLIGWWVTLVLVGLAIPLFLLKTLFYQIPLECCWQPYERWQHPRKMKTRELKISDVDEEFFGGEQEAAGEASTLEDGPSPLSLLPPPPQP